MGKKMESVPHNAKRQHFKVLLFADNPDHMKVFNRIKKHPELQQRYIGCWHVVKEDGHEIIIGQGKKHVHLLITFPNPRSWQAVAALVGADLRWFRPVGVADNSDIRKVETLRGGYEYLVHANAPEKGLISPSKLFGAEWMIQDAMQAINERLAKGVSMAGAVQAVCEYVTCCGNRVISRREFAQWLCGSPYFKAQQSRLAYEVLNEHNERVKRLLAAEAAQRRAASRDDIEHYCPPPENPAYYEDWGALM